MRDKQTLIYQMTGANSFATVDWSSAYYQIEEDDGAQKTASFIAYQGMYRKTKLQQGMRVCLKKEVTETTDASIEDCHKESIKT